MGELNITSLYSGSSGNSVYVCDGDDAILIDAGKSTAALCRALCEAGGDIGRVRAVFITHEHIDHVSALPVLCRKYHIPVHIIEDSAYNMRHGDALSEYAVTHPPLYCERVGAMTVKSFVTYHDSAAGVGYTVSVSEDVTLGVVTDTGHYTEDMTEALSGCTHVIAETNHDIAMLRSGPYPYHIKQRILSERGHLSNEQGAALIAELAGRGTRSFCLAHLSQNNNTPQLARRAVSEALADAGYAPDITVAQQYCHTRLL